MMGVTTRRVSLSYDPMQYNSPTHTTTCKKGILSVSQSVVVWLRVVTQVTKAMRKLQLILVLPTENVAECCAAGAKKSAKLLRHASRAPGP